MKIVDEKGKTVDHVDERYRDLGSQFYRYLNENNPYCEYINLAHNNQVGWITPYMENNLHSVIILNKKAKMGYYKDKSPFYKCEAKNANSLTFYCEPGSKIATDILSKCRDKEKYPEFYNATIVFMSPQLVAEYQRNLDDVDNYWEMKEFVKSYEEKKDYFSFKLSDCSSQRIEQLYIAQGELYNTWENFVNFMGTIGVKETSDVKNIETENENDKNNEIKKSDDKSEHEIKDENQTSIKDLTSVVSDKKEHEKDIKLIKEEAKIVEVDNKSEKGSKLKGENKTFTQNSGVGNLNLNQNTVDITKNLQPGKVCNLDIKKDNKSKINNEKENTKINNPEENLCGFMRYLKNHWPKIFKFINAIFEFFSRFKNEPKDDLKNSSVNTRGINLNQSLINKTSDLSDKKNVPSNMENQSVNSVLQQEQ